MSAAETHPAAGQAQATAMAMRLTRLKAQPRKPGEASFFYADRHFGMAAVKLLPGEYFVTDDDLLLMTVLGSCIAACLWDGQARVGGMNHFMLPEQEGAEQSGRYGAYAMELLINELLKKGARRERLQAKIFGGGQVVHHFTSMNVGERNAAFVTQYLQTEHIPIIARDVLDIHPRKVCFFPNTGRAMVRRLAHSHPEALVAQERRGRADTLARNTSGGSVDLF